MQNKQELKKKKKKQKIAIFKFVHQWLYMIVYYFILSLLYAHNFFTHNSAIAVKTFLRTWSAISALLFVLFCLIKVSEIFSANKYSKAEKFLHVTLTLLATIYFIGEFLRIIEIYYPFGLSKIKSKIHISLATLVYGIIFSCSMLISAFYAVSVMKVVYAKKKDNKEITSEVIALVCSSIDAVALMLFVIAYVLGDLEKGNIINVNAEVKLIKLGIFIFCSCLASITVSLSLYDKFRKQEESYILLEKELNNNTFLEKELNNNAKAESFDQPLHVVCEYKHLIA